MLSNQSDNPDQAPEQALNSIPLSRDQIARIEDSPLLPSQKLKVESQTTQLTPGTKSSTPKISSSFRRWWAELLAYGFAVCVFFILVMTLRPFQGDIASSWPLEISVNTFVSICNLIIKVLLGMILSNGIGQLKWVWFRQARPLVHLQRYDSASRGVVGSLGLLWTHCGRQIIPTLGALLLIFLTLADPFGQQLVRLENCTIVDDSIRSTIATTHHADILDGRDLNNIYHISASLYYIAPDAQALMIVGLLNETLIPSVTFDCPTGNCSYPEPYHSSGYCSRCTDLSNQVTGSPNSSWIWEAKNITLAADVHDMTDTSDFMTVIMNSSYIELPTIASFDIMGSQLENCENNSSSPWRCRGSGAATCELYACVISYTGEVNVGTLNEIITNTSAVWSYPEMNEYGGYLGSVDVSCLNTSELNALQQAGFDVGPNTNWLAFNVSTAGFDMNATSNETIFRSECLYVTDSIVLESITAVLYDLLDKTTVSLQIGLSGIQINGPVQWQALWNQGEMDFVNVQRAFDGLAKAMTYYARNNPVDALVPVGENYWNGTSYRDTTCIQIQWKWIIYLATTMFGVMIFLLGTMVMARPTLKDSEQDYKTSILPLMFHGVEFADSEASLKALKPRKEMTAEARNIYVTFEATENGWQFVEKKPV